LRFGDETVCGVVLFLERHDLLRRQPVVVHRRTRGGVGSRRIDGGGVGGQAGDEADDQVALGFALFFAFLCTAFGEQAGEQ